MPKGLSVSLLVVFASLLGLALPTAADAATPSFLCSRSNSWIEKTICASDRLAELDLEMAAVFARSLRVSDPTIVRSIQVEQHHWWSERARCQKDADPNACVERIYTERIAALRAHPSYPGDKPMSGGPRIIREVAIKDAGQGWSRDLSDYFKAIKLCTSKWKSPIRSVQKAWREGRGETISMWLRSQEDEGLICTASKNGQELKLIRPSLEDEEPPLDGPTLIIGAYSGECKAAVNVLDPQGNAFGWLLPSACTP